MAMKLPTGPKANFNTLAQADQLAEGRVYWLADTKELVVATGADTFHVFESAEKTRIAAAAYALAFGG